MKVLVTGAAGFIGYHVSKKLLKNGIEVIGFDNLNSYYDKKLKEDRIKDIQKNIKNKSNFSFVKNELSSSNGLKKTFENKTRSPRKPDDKKFLVKQLDIKDINVSATSAKLNLNQTVKLSDLKFENLGNTKESKNYKTIARETLDKAYNEIKDKLASGAIDQDVIKDKIKDKLKNKFKKLLK